MAKKRKKSAIKKRRRKALEARQLNEDKSRQGLIVPIEHETVDQHAIIKKELAILKSEKRHAR